MEGNSLKEMFPRHAALTQVLIAGSNSLQFPVENLRRGFPGARYADRFSVLVPFCLDYVKWDVVFNGEHPAHAPDIIFPLEDGKFQAALIADGNLLNPYAAWRILHDWNVNESSKLLELITELRSLYLQYQRKLVEKVEDPRVQFEIQTLSSMHGLEMCLIMVADKPSEVKFAVPLIQVDYNLGTVRLQEVIHLQVIYKIGQGWNFSVPQLKLFTPHRVKELFDVDDLKLPAWHDRMCIKEYLPLLKDRCKRQVHEAYTSVASRKTFIESLSVLFGHPIEADTIYGRKVSVLTSSATFIFLVHFGLGVQFPREQPTLTFQSCLHFDNNGKPVMRLYKEYPWSPRWETSEMVQRIFDFIAEESASFKSYCNDVLQNR